MSSGAADKNGASVALTLSKEDVCGRIYMLAGIWCTDTKQNVYKLQWINIPKWS
jgi:hypothetical protein